MSGVVQLPTRKNKKQQGGSNKKKGRNKQRCEIYRMINRRLSNKVRKMQRHIRKFPNDAQAIKALKKLQNKS